MKSFKGLLGLLALVGMVTGIHALIWDETPEIEEQELLENTPKEELPGQTHLQDLKKLRRERQS